MNILFLAAFTAFQYNSSKVGVLYNNGSTDTDTSTATVTVHKRQTVAAYTKYTIIADGNAGTVAVTNAFTGAEVANCSFTISTNFTVGSQLCLFASHATSAATANANYSSHFLYSFKVYDKDGVLKLDLVPAKNSSGTVGLYDTVSNSFKTKSTSTGSLTDTLIDKTFDDFVLIDDEVFGTVTVNSGKTLNLNGHNLTASAIAGSARSPTRWLTSRNQTATATMCRPPARSMAVQLVPTSSTTIFREWLTARIASSSQKPIFRSRWTMTSGSRGS